MIAPALWAGGHHVLAFLVAGLLAAEIALLRPGLDAAAARRLARIDLFYGLSFGILLLVGLWRAIMVEKGWGFYSSSPAFWLKMGLLGTITLLSLPPTFAYLRWSRAPEGAAPGPAEIARLSRILRAEALLFIPVPVLAALMARGD